MKISQTTFEQIFPNAAVGLYPMLAKHIKRAGCETKAQQAMFLAQCGHETAGFKVFVENLNYSADGLVRVWKRHFPTAEIARQYARKPMQIANRAYANRMGNGDEASGDGWRYRGRGLIQITGKYNYTKFIKWLGRDIVPGDIAGNVNRNGKLTLVYDLELVVLTAVWYWQLHNLAQIGSVNVVTKKINGGTHGLIARENLYRRLMA